MAIRVKKGGVYTDTAGIFAKKAGVYSAVDGVSAKVGGAYVAVGGPPAEQVAAMYAAKASIEDNVGDVSILAIGDSTGNDSNECFFLFAQWLSVRYPSHKVSYRLWNDAANIYGSEIVLGSGSGPNTIRVWNASVSATTTQYLMGAKFAASIASTSPHLVMWNHGKNMAALATQIGGGLPVLRGEFYGGMEQVRLALPGVPHVAIRQAPNRDDNSMQAVVEQLDVIAMQYGDLSRLDEYSAVMATGKNPSLYIDNLHPSAAGSELKFGVIRDGWISAREVPGFSVAPAFLASNGTNLLANAKFDDAATYSGGTPVGFSNLNATATVDVAIADAGKTQSLKLAGTTAGAAIYLDKFGITAQKGGRITLAVRQYIDPSGGAANAGMGRVVQNVVGSPTTSYTALSPGAQLTGGWRWIVIAGVDVNQAATNFRSLLYVDNNANVSSAVRYSRMILVDGDVPRNMA